MLYNILEGVQRHMILNLYPIGRVTKNLTERSALRLNVTGLFTSKNSQRMYLIEQEGRGNNL